MKKKNGKKAVIEQRKKEYEQYVSQFAPKTKWVSNSIKAFVVGGLVCCIAFACQQWITNTYGIENKTAGSIVTVGLIVLAQLLTGIGVFDVIAKFAGAGVIVPITGFANAMVATAMEFKYEGKVLGVGQKLFAVAGPVIVCGICSSVIIGIIYFLLGL